MKTFMMPEDCRAITFPSSPLGPNSMLNQYLDHCYLLGDPHLGKQFTTGVPVNKRGVREENIAEYFQHNVIGLKPGRKFHVCMGDLFDKFTVANKWVDFAYQTYREASLKHPDVTFIVLQGNHDGSRDVNRISSFQIFAELCKPLKNVRVLTHHPEFISYDGLNFLFVPWVPFQTTSELLELEFPLLNKVRYSPFAAFGHWDIQSHGVDINENIIPFNHFDRECCHGVVTGHYHKPERTVKSKIEVFVTGSMLPYAHGEESDNEPNPTYVSHSKTEVQANLETNPDYYSNKVLRVLLEDGEEPVYIDECLAITHKKASQLTNEEDIDVEVDGFDLKLLFNSVMQAENVSDELTKELWAKL